MSRIWKRWGGQDRKTRPTSPRRCLCLTSPPLHIRAVLAAHTAQAGPWPTQWLQLLHINMATEATGRGRQEKMEGAGPCAQLPPAPAARRQPSKKPARSSGTSTPAVPPNAGHNLVQNKHTHKTHACTCQDRQTFYPALLGSCRCSNTNLFIKQGKRTRPHQGMHSEVHQPHDRASCTDTWQAGLLHNKR